MSKQFFRELIAAGAVVAERPARDPWSSDPGKNRRLHQKFERLYHGPLLIPENVAALIAAHPTIKKTTCRKLVNRYSQGGWTWLFRCQIPDSRAMVGEITKTPEGHMRVHCWSAANPGTYRTPAELLARRERPDIALDTLAEKRGEV